MSALVDQWIAILDPLAAVVQEADRLAAATPPAPVDPLTWAHAHAVLRTADGRVLRYADAARGYQDAILADTADRVIIAKSRQIGISQTVAFVAAAEALAGGTVLWLSRNGGQAGLALDYVYTALSAAPHPAYVAQNRYSLTLANGGRVITQPATRGAGRGIPATLVIVDEQAWQEFAREVYTAVVPTLATTGGRLIVLSTPKGRGNLFQELWDAAQAEGSPWSCHFLPWTVHPDWDEAWAAAREDELGPEAFAQEHGVDFAVSGSARFDPADVAALWTMPGLLPPEKGHRYVTAWDIARKHDAFVGFTFDVSTAPFRVVAYERHLRLSYPDQAAAIEERDRLYSGYVRGADGWVLPQGGPTSYDRPQNVTWVESNGVGDPLIQFLTVRVREFTTTALTKRNALDALKLLLQRRELIAPRLPDWERELLMYQDADAGLSQDTVMSSAIAASAAGRPVRKVTFV